MPKLPIAELVKGLTDDEAKLIRAAFSTRGEKALRTAKPFAKVNRDAPDAMFQGSANYVWRMLAFDYVGYHPHSCMPVTADWDIPIRDYEERRKYTKQLDDIIKRAESNLPLTMQRGTMVWGRALGYLPLV